MVYCSSHFNFLVCGLTPLLECAVHRSFERETWKHRRPCSENDKLVLFKKGGEGGGGFIPWFKAKVGNIPLFHSMFVQDVSSTLTYHTCSYCTCREYPTRTWGPSWRNLPHAPMPSRPIILMTWMGSASIPIITKKLGQTRRQEIPGSYAKCEVTLITME